MKCKACGSEKTIKLGEYADNSSRTIVSIEHLCVDCKKHFFTRHYTNKAYNTTEKFIENGDF